MIGAGVSIIPTYMSFSLEKITTTIKNEKLTDLILTDDFAQPALINSIISKKRELGLYNVIVLHVPVGGNAVDGLITAGQKYKHFIDRMTIAPICMDALMELYSDGPIDYAPEESSEASIILHTSGTTSGTGKPIPISDAAINSIGKVYEVLEKRYPELENNIVCGVTIDLSNSYSTVNQIHGPFTLGGTIIMVPGCAMNPAFYKSVPEFRQTLLFVTAAFLEIWMKVPDRSKLDFSSLRLLVLGGSFVSAADKHRYLEFLTECGAKDLKIINGYGLTELGGACILSTEDIDDEAIGYPMPGVTMLLYDEDKKKYFTAKDAPCSGILYLRSDLMTGGFLGDKEVVKTEAIDGEKYICTNDIVRLDKTGKCYFLGRANRYFINDSGKKFESGRVEVAISRQPGIESCVVVPMYLKLIHDNIPMLCVKTHDEDRAKETVRKALIKVYKTEGFLPADQMPHRILITEEMPRNGNGKADIFKIMRGEAEGIQYSVKPIKIGSKLMDITLEQLDPESEKEEILQNAYKTIAKDLLESNNPIKNIKMEEITMNQSNPFEFFKEMNNKQTEAFKKMFENNPYCQGYKDYYEKQAETFKKMFENNQYCQNYKEYFEKATKKYKEMAENFKPDTTRAKEYNKILKDHNEKMYKMSVEMVKDMNKENKQFMETFFGMVKEDAEIQKETAKKAAAKQKEAFKKAAEKQKETIKKAAAKAAPAKKAEAPKAAAKPAAKAAPKAAAKKPAAKKAPAKKAAKKTK